MKTILLISILFCASGLFLYALAQTLAALENKTCLHFFADYNPGGMNVL